MLQDVVEFRYDYKVKKFIKQATPHYNIPKSMAYGLKKQIEAQRESIKLKDITAFIDSNSTKAMYLIVVVPNGTYQYTNEFKRGK
jgi:hypothetical protein